MNITNRLSMITVVMSIFVLQASLKNLNAKPETRGVGSYQKGPKIPAYEDGKFVARYIKADDSLFENPSPQNGPWQRIVPKTIQLLPQNITQPSKFTTSISSVDVRLVHNGNWLGVMLSWDSQSPQSVTSTGYFSDAAAVGFPIGDPSTTSPFMGGAGSGVEILYWKSLWQSDIEKGYQDVTDEFPNTTADTYRGYQQNPYDTNPASQIPVEKVLDGKEAKQALPAVALGNSQSQLHREHPVESLVAEGFGTLSTHKLQFTRGWGFHKDDRWHVVLTKPLTPRSKTIANLTSEKDSAINFAIWDGRSNDVGAKKNYSMFTPLKIEAKQ